MQLMRRPPINGAHASRFYESRFDWIKFNEPESHLEDTARMIRSLDGITKGFPNPRNLQA